MEQRRFGSQGSKFSPSYSPPTLAPDFSSHTPRRSFWPEAAFQTPDALNLFPGNETLQSALSRLSLSPNFHPQTPSPSPSPLPPGTLASSSVQEADSSSLGYFNPLNPGYQEWNNVGSQGGGVQNYLGHFAGAHRNLLVGPDPRDCGPGIVPARSGGVYREPCYGDWSALWNTELNKDEHSQRANENGYSYLQSKQALSSGLNAQFPCFSSNQTGVARLNLDAHENGLVWKNSSALRPNSLNNRQIYARNNNPFDGPSLQDMRGSIIAISKDQSGSKILQSKMDDPNVEEIEMVLCEVIESVADLMKNQSSSYFVQKLFGVCSEEQRTRIIVALTKTSFQLVDVCLDFNGARTMQKLLENLSTPEQISLVISALCPGGVTLANDPNGQHVIRYCLINYPNEYHKHLLNEIANNCYRIATDKSGCCVLQSCVEHAHGEPKERLIKEIITNALQLSEDPYGNYVVQHLLGLKMPQVTALLLGKLQGHFVALSSDKYGSNVVEKFLVEAGREHSTMIIMEILANPNADSLLVHPYGNFVIQKALSISRGGEIYGALCKLIEMNAPSMRSNLFGKKILAWFEKRRQVHVV